MNILVTGGAGYIGSHTLRFLTKEGFIPIIVDNLVNGHKESLPDEVKFYELDLRDKGKLETVFKENKIDAVMHFAAFIEAGVSMKDPKLFYDNNIICAINLLDLMIQYKVKNIVFSSTAALYGNPDRVPIKEDDLIKPVNVYGTTKMIVETMLRDYSKSYDLKYASLRYFNASGAGFGVGEDHDPESHLIPLLLQVALGKRNHLKVFGTDYDTEDGTAIRDYIHVCDLAEAHILALKKLLGSDRNHIYNLGSGKGYSVREIIKTAEEVLGMPLKTVDSPRREGDPEVLIADSTKIKKELGWDPKHDLKDIISSAWEWHKGHPNGY